MSTTVARRETCRLCGGRDVELVLPLAPTPVGDAYRPAERIQGPDEMYPLELFLCRGCGHAQLLDVVDPEVLYDHFLYETSISLGLVEHFKGYAEDVLRRVQPPAGSLVIDIGSNDGTLLGFFQARGLRALGVDPAREIAQKAAARGVETLAAFFTAELARRLRRECGSAMIVTANNTFANVDDLTDLAEGIRELLDPQGVFVFETGYLVDLIQQGLVDNIYHEHLGYFSVGPLDRFLRAQGLELINVERIGTKGGSLRGMAQPLGAARAVSPSVGRLIALERELELDRPEPFRRLADALGSAKATLLGLLRDLKARGQTIAGYGASVGVTTLMHYFELGELLDFLVDDNPAKHHTLSPNYRIPVLPPAALSERRPDALVILAWRYAEPIIAKQQAYLKQGGRVIIPLPRVQVR